MELITKRSVISVEGASFRVTKLTLSKEGKRLLSIRPLQARVPESRVLDAHVPDAKSQSKVSASAVSSSKLSA
ncbi:MAG: hypothetical protein SFZ23_04995 [Planctomycetota bacterium]|nr:hypothetical protein [Planctomycetota bacterium]